MQDDLNSRQKEVARTSDPDAGRPSDRMTVVDSAQLFADRREVQIRHRGDLYRLLMTKNGKLILNK
jgi:hemin uptake protein HemP